MKFLHASGTAERQGILRLRLPIIRRIPTRRRGRSKPAVRWWVVVRWLVRFALDILFNGFGEQTKYMSSALRNS